MNPPVKQSETPSRWLSFDIAKGIAATLMILGHAQIFFDPYCFFPPPPAKSYPAIDHFAQYWVYVFQSSVDAFYFCAGIMIGLKWASAKPAPWSQFALAMLKRGLFLVVVDITLISWCYGPVNGSFHPTFGSIACFGVSFLLIPFFSRSKPLALVCVALGLMLIREILIVPYPFDAPAREAIYGVFWAPVNTDAFDSLFVVICWFPIMIFGVAFGKKFNQQNRNGQAFRFALAAISCATTFLILRLSHPFGSLGQSVAQSLTQVFQLGKYPAGIQFHLLNMSFCFGYLWFGALWEARPYFLKTQQETALLGRQIFFVYLFHLVFFGVLKHGLNILPSDGSLGISFALFLICLLVSVKMAYFYEIAKMRYRKKFFLLRYI